MTPATPRSPPGFDGFPYLVTRIGRTPLRHLSLLPADWSRARLLDIARRQVAANRLDACLCLGRGDAVYLYADGTEAAGTQVLAGVPVKDGLRLSVELPGTEELGARKAAFEAFCERLGSPDGFIVGDGLEGGRRATPADVTRLDGRDEEGIPAGLRRCVGCGHLRGEYLAARGEGNGDMTPRVVEVHCRCQNHNRCARCGGPLAAGRLSAYEYDEAAGRLLYRAAYAGLDHRCP